MTTLHPAPELMSHGRPAGKKSRPHGVAGWIYYVSVGWVINQLHGGSRRIGTTALTSEAQSPGDILNGWDIQSEDVPSVKRAMDPSDLTGKPTLRVGAARRR